jgi:hypothetical protein
MVRMITQILVGLMLLFGVLTLIPKAYLLFKEKRSVKGTLYLLLAFVALFFSSMAFYYAYLLLYALER